MLSRFSYVQLLSVRRLVSTLLALPHLSAISLHSVKITLAQQAGTIENEISPN
ncbi:MAG: hypothetical protein ACK41G_08200 [Candidatus Thermochlorobacter sp.]